MSDKVEATDKDREKNIKKYMQEMKERYDTVNSKLQNLETRMDTMSRDVYHTVQTRCHLEKLYRTRQSGNKSNTRQHSRFRGTTTEQTGVNIVTVKPGCSKHSTGGGGAIMKSGTTNTTNGPGDSTTNNNVGPDAMTWAST